MKNTGHGISDQQWVDYLEGTLPPDESARVQSHLSVCGDCQSLFAQLSSADAGLFSETTRLAQAIAVDDETVDRIRSGVLRRVRRTRDVPARIERLRDLVSAMCGAGTADGLIRNELHSLGSVVETLCGVSAARLVVQTARNAGLEASQ